MKKTLLKTLPAVALLLAGLSSAHASATLEIKDNNGHDTGLINDVGGFVIFNGSLGAWTVVVDHGSSPPSSPNLDFGGVDIFGGGTVGNVLTIIYNVTLAQPKTGGITFLNTGVANSAAINYTININGNPTPIATFTAVNGGLSANVNGATLITETMTLTEPNVAGDLTSFDNLTTLVPDSGTTLMLLGSSLTVLGLFARSRKVVA